MTRFGQCCLLARRLIEAGVRFVTINTFLTVFDEITWDIHGSQAVHLDRGDAGHRLPDVRPGVQRADRGPRTSAGCSTTTLVCNLAEFGRTPRVNPAGGRDHWPQCLTVCFAGGGVKGGRVVGESDAIGACPAGTPVEPADSRRDDLPQPRLRPRDEAARARPAGRSRWSILGSRRSKGYFER